MKVVINNVFGGFSLLPLAAIEFYRLKGITVYLFEATHPDGDYDKTVYVRHEEMPSNSWINTLFDVINPNGYDKKELWGKHHFTTRPQDRTDMHLIEVVEKFGKLANGACSGLKIVEIPDDIKWYIDEYDGNECVRQEHETWS